MVGEGRFLEDLFYRLSVIPIPIPPLRERREDIPALTEHFIGKHTQRSGKRIDRVEEAVLEAFREYDWPGHVRELENTTERAVAPPARESAPRGGFAPGTALAQMAPAWSAAGDVPRRRPGVDRSKTRRTRGTARGLWAASLLALGAGGARAEAPPAPIRVFEMTASRCRFEPETLKVTRGDRVG